jgi:hypothetical protein
LIASLWAIMRTRSELLSLAPTMVSSDHRWLHSLFGLDFLCLIAWEDVFLDGQ